MSRLENPDITFDPSLNIPQGLVDIINKCLKVKIEDRYHSAMEVLEAISHLNIEFAHLGNGYTQEIYNGVASPVMADGIGMKFDNSMATNYYMPAEMPVQQDNSGLMKGIIAAACTVVLLVIAIIVVSQL